MNFFVVYPLAVSMKFEPLFKNMRSLIGFPTVVLVKLNEIT